MVHPAKHADCREWLRREMESLGCEVTVSAAQPLVLNDYGPQHATCPHGVTYWFEPTSEQIAQWVKDEVA